MGSNDKFSHLVWTKIEGSESFCKHFFTQKKARKPIFGKSVAKLGGELCKVNQNYRGPKGNKKSL